MKNRQAAERTAMVCVLLVLSACTTGTSVDDGSPASDPGSSPLAAAASPTPCPSVSDSNAIPTAPGIRDMPEGFAIQEPGTYANEVAYDPCPPIWVLFTVPADGWRNFFGTFKPEEGEGCDPAGLHCPAVENRGVAVYFTNVTNLVADACLDHKPADPPVGPTVDDLATALAALPPFLVTSPPADVTMAGYSGKHLELTVPDMPFEVRADRTYFTDCFDDSFMTWMSEPLSYAFYGYHGPAQIEEFWVLDVEGSRLLIAASWFPNSPAEDIAEMRSVLSSIQIVR